MANPALINAIAAAVARAVRRYKAAALDGVYPGSPEHQAALRSVRDRTAPQFTYWPVPADRDAGRPRPAGPAQQVTAAVPAPRRGPAPE
ncbi:hypothetical protein ACFCYI_28130 [Streptomyces sp. NPDC056257]|uniref:hypothetical protein n=1 Tax=Streptomyces sp. NPDC056257 TaxID=3345765 RepID=UPI0035DB45A7